MLRNIVRPLVESDVKGGVQTWANVRYKPAKHRALARRTRAGLGIVVPVLDKLTDQIARRGQVSIQSPAGGCT
jgi:hypothetical protein